MITLENFSKDNRSKVIQNSLYRICQDRYTKFWYIFEIFNDLQGDMCMGYDDFRSKNLVDVIDRFNNIKSEKEIVSKIYN